MYIQYYTRRFERALRKVLRSGQVSRELIVSVIEMLAAGIVLDRKYNDHQLGGHLAEYRECHIKPDLLLIYKIVEEIQVLQLVDLGSHAQLFGE